MSRLDSRVAATNSQPILSTALRFSGRHAKLRNRTVEHHFQPGVAACNLLGAGCRPHWTVLREAAVPKWEARIGKQKLGMLLAFAMPGFWVERQSKEGCWAVSPMEKRSRVTCSRLPITRQVLLQPLFPVLENIPRAALQGCILQHGIFWTRNFGGKLSRTGRLQAYSHSSELKDGFGELIP